MRTACTHCGAHFEVPDKTLGKQAQCKACGKLFVLTPASAPSGVPMQDIKPPTAHGSTTHLRPVQKRELAEDPLDALADAAVDSGSHLRPVHGVSNSTSQRHRAGDSASAGPVRTARGAVQSLVFGVLSLSMSMVGVACVIITILKADDQGLLVALGVSAMAFVAIAAVLAMVAVTHGASAMKRIRQARHPLDGRSQAGAGTLTGWISLLLVLGAIITGAVWLSQRGGIVFEKTVGPEAAPPPQADPQAPQ